MLTQGQYWRPVSEIAKFPTYNVRETVPPGTILKPFDPSRSEKQWVDLKPFAPGEYYRSYTVVMGPHGDGPPVFSLIYLTSEDAANYNLKSKLGNGDVSQATLPVIPVPVDPSLMGPTEILGVDPSATGSNSYVLIDTAKRDSIKAGVAPGGNFTDADRTLLHQIAKVLGIQA